MEKPERSGWTDLAGSLLICIGIGHLVFGLAAINGATALVDNVTEIELDTGLDLYKNLTAWGWILIALGLAEAGAGIAVWRRTPLSDLTALLVAYTGIIGTFFTFAIIRLPTVAFLAGLLLAIYLLSYYRGRHGQ